MRDAGHSDPARLYLTRIPIVQLALPLAGCVSVNNLSEAAQKKF